MSDITAVADAVVAALKDGDFSIPFVPERLWQSYTDAADLQTVRVSVIPGSEIDSPLTRISTQKTVSLFVVVQKKLGGKSNSDIDPWWGLVQEIKTYLQEMRTTLTPLAVLLGAMNQSPVFERDALREHGIFESVIPLDFRVL